MSKEIKKYNWFYNDGKYTLFEYLTKVEELISSPVQQMQELDGDLFMSEYQRLVEGASRLNNLIDQLKEEQGGG